MPASRFNIDAHYHENLERPGSFNVLGGYFLDEDPSDFDPTFFGITPVEAMWLDPQQRKMLEVSYECLESAGLSLDAVAGSNTAVFVGSFTSDYQQMSTKEPDFRHNYAATGVDPGLISNRIGNTFNLRGPSFTINTACSSSVYAIHNACHALRARDCEAAIAGGVNLVLTVDQHMNTAKLGILSPTSTCHTFDASADGYGRAEGVGALYLKRLSDAIRDGDPVRAVIRSSAVNTNGKVPGMGITHPSSKGQELVVRKAYERANLDPNKTAYLEMHGTGTPVGDPIETRAVANAMNDTRSKDKPLLVGAIKANIGHSEAASGIFAVMKAAMMTEDGVIPGVSGFKTLNPAIQEKEWNVKVNVDTTPWPKDFAVRRAGVSSFGYGGTNGHVILESVNSMYPWYQHGKPKSAALYDNSSSRPLLVSFSAHDKVTLLRNVAAHGAVADQFFLIDLAHTLNTKRSRLAQRAYTIVREGHEVEDFNTSSLKIAPATKAAPDLGFIFTGQGAQWAGMGIEAMRIFPSFRETIQKLDGVLKVLETPPKWKLEEVLLAPSEISPINDAQIAQPVCTAIQIAIVDLLAQWGIVPTVTVGHSSGEIGAAYAAGLHSAPEAIIAAYFRGLTVKNYAPSGTMLAVGLGADAVAEYVGELGDDVIVACENSPESTTLSGTIEVIAAVKAKLDARNIFARELKTGKAYHSSQMDAVAAQYNHALARAYSELEPRHLDWCQQRARMISSVTGEEIVDEGIPITYWSHNLRNRVLFNTVITVLAKNPEFAGVTTFIEIGPHSALAGPFKQICIANKFENLLYVPTFVRKADSAVQLLKAAGDLLIQDYALDIDAVNAIDQPVTLSRKQLRRPHILVDLPPYQWNYEKKFWTEPQASQEQRSLKFGRHDLLGSRVSGLSDRSVVWKNMLRHRDIPWIKDHSLGGSAIFPAAGHMSMAIEAFRQICEIRDYQLSGAALRDVNISTALVIPETDNGIEVQLRLQESSKSDAGNRWYSFTVESRTDSQWTAHCEGRISYVEPTHVENRDLSNPVTLNKLTHRVPGKRWYDAFHRVGFQYEGTFQPLSQIRTNGKDREAAANIIVATESGRMAGESRYILHPATIDACLQLIIISINKGQYKEIPWGVVPLAFEEIKMWFPGTEAGSPGHAVAWTDDCDARYFNTHTKLHTKNGQLVLDVKNLQCVAYEAAVPQKSSAEVVRQPYSQVSWKPDISSLNNLQAIQAYPGASSEWECIGRVVELLSHKNSLKDILILGLPTGRLADAIVNAVSPLTTITVSDSGDERLQGFSDTRTDDRISTLTIPESPDKWASSGIELKDLVISVKSFIEKHQPQEFLTAARSLLTDSGSLIFSADKTRAEFHDRRLEEHGFSVPILHLPLPETSIILSSTVAKDTKAQKSSHSVELFGLNDAALDDLARHLASHGCQTSTARLTSFNVSKAETNIIYDFDGSILTNLDAESFDALKAILCSGKPTMWISRGVNEGQSISGGMVQGFLRAIRSEQAAAKLMLVDVNAAESAGFIADFAAHKLCSIFTKDSGTDTEFWVKDGVAYVPRIIANKKLNESFTAGNRPAEETILPIQKAMEGSITDSKLIFAPSPETPLGPQEIEMQVLCSELDRKDLQNRSDTPLVVAGKVVRVGERANTALLGQQCATFFTRPFATIVRVPESLCVTGFSLDPTAIASTLPSLCKVVNVLVTIAKVQPKEHVLLMPAPGPVLRTVLALSNVLGFRVTVVATSEREKAKLTTKHTLSSDTILSTTDISAVYDLLTSETDTPSVVVANDFSPICQEIWRLTPAFARFVLCETAIDAAPDVLPFNRGASFSSSSIKALYKRDPSALVQLMQRSINLIVSNSELVVKNAVTVDVSALKDTAVVSANLAGEDGVVLAYRYGLTPVLVENALPNYYISR